VCFDSFYCFVNVRRSFTKRQVMFAVILALCFVLKLFCCSDHYVPILKRNKIHVTTVDSLRKTLYLSVQSTCKTYIDDCFYNKVILAYFHVQGLTGFDFISSQLQAQHFFRKVLQHRIKSIIHKPLQHYRPFVYTQFVVLQYM